MLELQTNEELEVVDITTDVEKIVLDSEIQDGWVLVHSLHTTFGLVLNEWEDGLIEDFKDVMRALVDSECYYRHDDFEIRVQNLQDDEPKNAHAHLRYMLAGRASECVALAGGRLALGHWQRILAVEFDRPRSRVLSIQVCGS